MRMRYVFRVFYRKSVRKFIQTVSVRNRIIQNLNNNGACARSGYQAFFPPPPSQKALGRGLVPRLHPLRGKGSGNSRAFSWFLQAQQSCFRVSQSDRSSIVFM